MLTRPLDKLPDPLPIVPLTRPFDVTIRPPGSKSITNRALLLAALANGTSTLRGALIDADDAQVMIRALGQLGAKIEIQRARSAGSGQAGADRQDEVRVTGVGGRWRIAPGQTVTINLNNAGTATRFLTAAAILAPPDSGGIIIDGDARMRERPIGELLELLGAVGVRCTGVVRPGYPPVHVHPPASLASMPAELSVGTTASSQFISALMLVAPWLPRGLRLRFTGPVTSRSYIKMSQELLDEVGGTVEDEFDLGMIIRPGARRTYNTTPGLAAFDLQVEPDASGATYFWAAAALFDGARCLVPGLDWTSVQYDQHFEGVVGSAGAISRVDEERTAITGSKRVLPLINADLTLMPDTAMTAAVLCCFASPTAETPTATSTLHGLRTLRVKETDRLAALQAELSKLGATVEIFEDWGDEGMRITPPTGNLSLARESMAKSRGDAAPAPIYFDTYHDHRMAMALALVGLRRPNVFIRDPGCVRKTYPTYWQDLARLYA